VILFCSEDALQKTKRREQMADLKYPVLVDNTEIFVDMDYSKEHGRLIVIVDLLVDDVDPDNVLDFLVTKGCIDSKHNLSHQGITGKSHEKTYLIFQ